MKKKSWTCIIGTCDGCPYRDIVCFQPGPSSGAWRFEKRDDEIHLRGNKST